MNRHKMLPTLTAMVVLVALSLSSVSGIPRVKSSTKHDDIVRLLELTEANKTSAQYLDQLFKIIRQSGSIISDEYLEAFREEIDMGELTDIIVTIYDRNLSQSEIRELIKFYESPIGRKLVSVMPSIIQDSISESQKWTQRIIEKVMQRLEDDEVE